MRNSSLNTPPITADILSPKNQAALDSDRVRLSRFSEETFGLYRQFFIQRQTICTANSPTHDDR